jgi:hypothetical protein
MVAHLALTYGCVRLLARLVLKAFVYWHSWDRTVQLLVRIMIVYLGLDHFKVVHCGTIQQWVHDVVLERLELFVYCGPVLPN